MCRMRFRIVFQFSYDFFEFAFYAPASSEELWVSIHVLRRAPLALLLTKDMAQVFIASLSVTSLGFLNQKFVLFMCFLGNDRLEIIDNTCSFYRRVGLGLAPVREWLSNGTEKCGITVIHSDCIFITYKVTLHSALLILLLDNRQTTPLCEVNSDPNF